MSDPSTTEFLAGGSPQRAQLFDDLLELLRRYAGPGRVAVGLAGSRGKQMADARSDIDLRLYLDTWAVSDGPRCPDPQRYNELRSRGRELGCVIDNVWPRTIAEVDAQLERCLRGDELALEMPWTIWGYQLPTDLASQRAVYDPDGVIVGWRDTLRDYPDTLKRTILEKHLPMLRHWRHDYHYASKADRGDAVFLASLAARVVHSALRVLYAANEIYDPGDGWNLAYLSTFDHAPENLGELIERCLYPSAGPDRYVRQRDSVLLLIDQIEPCVTAAAATTG